MKIVNFLLTGLISHILLPSISTAESPPAKDIASRELQQLAVPFVMDESIYGCGPMIHPGKTYYLTPKGDDGNDGLSWETSWKHLSHSVTKLKPGDTLLLGEGEYSEPGLKIDCSGEPGKPVVIAAAPGSRVLFTGAVRPGPLVRTPKTLHTYEVAHKIPRNTPLHAAGIWEEPAVIKLENAGNIERVDELPGTFFYDGANGKLYVRFSNDREIGESRLAVTTVTTLGRHDRYGGSGAGAELTGSYVHLRGINFRYGFAALAVYDGHHNTIEGCSFFATDLAGLLLWRKATNNLVKNNYLARNGLRGSILIDKTGDYQRFKELGSKNLDGDNLFTGNRIDSSSSTLRTAEVPVYTAIRTYGWPGPRNHIINNILNEPDIHSFLWRGVSIDSVFEGNVLTGHFHAINWHGEFAEDKSERIIVKSNTILGRAAAEGLTMDSSGITGNWAAKDIAFFNNLVMAGDENKIKEARFADAEYLDYRLQSDSPHKDSGFNGGNKGAYLHQKGRIFYISESGDDRNEGTSERLSFRTLKRATRSLQKGDTLYVSEGVYEKPLVVSTSGVSGEPIRLRAHGRKDVFLAGLILNGSHIEAEGFTVAGRQGDGVSVKGRDVFLKRCLFSDNSGAGIKAENAADLKVYNCTFANNGTGLSIQSGSTGAAVRDNIFTNNGKAISIRDDSRTGFMSSHNAYDAGSEKGDVSEEWAGITADLHFIGREMKDYRIKASSPAAHMGIFSNYAGAFPPVFSPEIKDIKIVRVRDRNAVIAWNTPFDDTSGRVFYRNKGGSQWNFVSTRPQQQGTVHSVGLDKLKPGSEYEFKVEVTGRRGGKKTSGTFNFKTLLKLPPPSTFYLSAGGNDNSDGLSPTTAWRTMRKANRELGPGDTLLLESGEYIHPVAPLVSGYPDKRITYRAQSKGKAVLNGYNALSPLISIEAVDYITVDGVLLESMRDGIQGAVEINNSSGVEILNCRVGDKKAISATFTKAFIVNSSPGLLLEGNTVWGTRYHFVGGGMPDLVVRNNTFVGGAVCIFKLDSGTKVKFSGNIFYNTRCWANYESMLIFRNSLSDIESDYNLFCATKSNGDSASIANVYVYDSASTSWKKAVPGSTLKEWKKTSGLDRNSIQQDPLFEDAENGDFRLRPGSPAIGKGEGGRNIGAY